MIGSSKVRANFGTLAAILFAAGGGLAAGPVAHGIINQVSAAQAKAIWKEWKGTHVRQTEQDMVAAGQPAFWLRVPSCKISTLVLQESDAEALHRFPAVRRDEDGNLVVFAHRDIHFRPLGHIQVGEEIRIEAANNSVATYRVRSIRILLPEELTAALEESEGEDSLHLLTCYPFRYIGAAPKRFLVTAIRLTG